MSRIVVRAFVQIQARADLAPVTMKSFALTFCCLERARNRAPASAAVKIPGRLQRVAVDEVHAGGTSESCPQH